MAFSAHADHFRLAIAPEDDLYIGDILAFALQAEGAGHTMEVVRIPPVSQARALRVLEDGSGAYDVIYSAYAAEREVHLAMVHFPLTRGMLGYRVLAVRDDGRSKLSPDISFERLQSDVCFGTGVDWPDTAIMRLAGLCVVTGSDDSLWPMLARGRYDAFPRGLVEVVAELRRKAHEYRGSSLILNPDVMLAYRQDLFFFLARRDLDRAAIIEAGLTKAHADGSYDRFLYNIPTIREALAEIASHNRTTFHLGSPPGSAALALVPEDYWYSYDDAAAVTAYMNQPGEAMAR